MCYRKSKVSLLHRTVKPSIKPTGGGLFISSTFDGEGGGRLNREEGLFERGPIKFSGTHYRCMHEVEGDAAEDEKQIRTSST